MQNLSEITERYIELTYTPELQSILLTSFSLLETFGLNFYEDKYLNLIAKDESLDKDVRADTFVNWLKQDIYTLIKEHLITLDEEQDIHLRELNEICHFLYIIQNLEDYNEVIYVLSSDASSRKKVISLIERYTLLSEVRLLELIKEVNENLLIGLEQFAEDRSQDEQETLDEKHLNYVNLFFKFTNGVPSLGKTLFLQGYNTLTLKELTNLITFNLSKHIDDLITTNAPQAALDVLSTLIITKDDYSLPLLKFQRHTLLFTEHLENVTRINAMITNMLSDFTAFVKANEEAEKLNDN